MNRWSRLHRGVDRLAALFCRHEAGTVCVHRQWEHDIRYRAYIDGWAKATQHAADKADPFYPWPREPADLDEAMG